MTRVYVCYTLICAVVITEVDTPCYNRRTRCTNMVIANRRKNIIKKIMFFKKLLSLQFGEIQKFSRLAGQAGESNNKYTVNCIFVQKSRNDYTLSYNI